MREGGRGDDRDGGEIGLSGCSRAVGLERGLTCADDGDALGHCGVSRWVIDGWDC